jgi:hypothetical protein
VRAADNAHGQQEGAGDDSRRHHSQPTSWSQCRRGDRERERERGRMTGGSDWATGN